MNIIKQLRKEKDLKQEYIAYRCKVTQQAVARWENGSARPNYKHLKMLAKIFDCELELIGDELNGYGKKV